MDALADEQRALLLPREIEVMDLFASGLSAAQIGKKLGLGRSVVQSYRCRAMRKLGHGIYDVDDFETPAEAEARIVREIAEGKRCPICRLLAPCGGRECGLLETVRALPRGRRDAP